MSAAGRNGDSAAAAPLQLEIDGRCISAAAGATLLDAATAAGIDIPRLCAGAKLKPAGACRLCLVEIEGRSGFPAACTTPAAAGMKVRSQSPRLLELRRNILELHLSDHPPDCLTCAANGDCELQQMAARLGVREMRHSGGDNHYTAATVDDSNPYFRFDPGKCIVCGRCLRACAEQQGDFAISFAGRGFATRVNAGGGDAFIDSECVSCGACVSACPTAALIETNIITHGRGQRTVTTTCAYCGVGCSLVAELDGDRLVRMTPAADGAANQGHACIKGRFAWGYANHRERLRTPLLRQRCSDPWREVTWQEAFEHIAAQFRRIQAQYGDNAIGALVSSRCSNEEDYLTQKMVRAAFANNNVDTCARVCHAPTGYGLGQTLGTSAGTQTFSSIEHADVIMVIGANPDEAHPVFASRLRRRLRAGAQLIVIDPRRIDLVSSPHLRASCHLQLRPGTNVAALTAMAHVIVSEGLVNQAFVASRCDAQSWRSWSEFVSRDANSPEAMAAVCGAPAQTLRAAARLYAGGGKATICYGLGVTEHVQGSTAVIAIANLAMATGALGREGVGVMPLRGQNNVQGCCDMGGFPHQLPGYRPVDDDAVRSRFEAAWGVKLQATPGLRFPEMLDAALAGTFRGLYCQGEDPAQSDPNTQRVQQALAAMECVVVQDLFANETARFAHVLLPGASFLEKDGTFTNAERRISRVRKAMPPLSGLEEWQVTAGLSTALGYPMHYNHPSEIMDEIAALTPAFAGVSYPRLDACGSLQWPCHEKAPQGTPILHIKSFARPDGKARFIITQYLASDEKTTPHHPLLLTTGRVLTQYNAGTQTRRTENNLWYTTDRLEIHPADAALRRIRNNDLVHIESSAGATTLRALITERVQPGVVYCSFHFPESGANVITTGKADWATSCPEYKVIAVQVKRTKRPSAWQRENERLNAEQKQLLAGAGS